jgi:myo-inositol-1(or 4)-monophosphatase
VQPEALLALFDDLTAELIDALAGLDDWGLSGQVEGQYRHDLVADDIFVPALTGAGFRVLTEESGITGEGEITVVVDPVDGSTNASIGLPWYATSLCAVDSHGPLAASVMNLATGQRFQAIRGQGAEVDEASLEPSTCNQLSDAIVAFSGWPTQHGGWRQYRTYGAGALDMCSVASGVFDAFVDVDRAHGVWDYLGAYLVCAEAGLTMVDSAGEELVVLEHGARRGPVVAATAELASEILAKMPNWS